MATDGRPARRRRDRRGRHPRAERHGRATRTTRRPTPRPSRRLVPHRRPGHAWTTEGYLRVTGRLKEIINRGGEKISPREVDEVLLDHPAVAQVVTFAMPHDKLGEEVAAAVVLREGTSAERERDPRVSPPAGSPTSRCRGRSSSSPRSRRARPASCSASGSPQKLGLG